MSKKFLLSTLFLAVVGFCGAASAADVGRVKAVGAAGPGTILVGQDGALGTNTVYQLSTLGTAPAGITNTPQYANGTELLVSLDFAGVSSGSFIDFVRFKVPALSTTTTTATEFNLSVMSFLSFFTRYQVSLYAGLPTFSAAVLNNPIANMTFGGLGQALPTTTGSFTENLLFNQDYFLKVEGTVVTNSFTPTYHLALVATPVPEPGTYATLLAGLAAMGYLVKRRKSSV